MGKTPDEFEARPVKNHPGWVGLFTRAQHSGAYANGSRVVKVRTEKDDGHALGALATVLGSIGHPEIGIGYFVEWDNAPRVAVFVVAWKLGPARTEHVGIDMGRFCMSR